METARKKLRFHIQCGSVGLEHDEVFLQQAQSACLGDLTVGRGSGHNTPHTILGGQRPDISTHSLPVGPVVRVISPDIIAMFPPAFLESPASQSGIKLHSASVSSLDLGPVDHGLHRSIRINSALAG